jgi:NADPH-dependent glutamate synthase beta subunit-like oxidoreductase/NAD-dependent dihydropyrimidine dehydrogenase PreA subunit
VSAEGVLIVGAGPTAIQAALDTADGGVPVHIVTSSPFLEDAFNREINPIVSGHRLLEIAKHPLIRLWTRAEPVSATGKDGSYSVLIRRTPRFVDISKCTACGDCVDACPVTVFGAGGKAVRLPEFGVPGCAAIDKQGTAPCTAACPGGIPVQGYISLISRGRFQEALDLVEEAIPFPGICGRVCTHPCEIDCRRAEIDAPVAIRLLKRFVSDNAFGRVERPSTSISFHGGARVAVIGAGPAGMTSAYRLAKLGYRVTVFEKLPVIGGMMGIGIPEYRLPREIIEKEYRRIRESGVEVRLNTTVGPNGRHSLDDLFDMGYRAVLLAVGAHQSLNLNIPGESLPGVIQGLELLRAIRMSQNLEDPLYTETLSRLSRPGPDMRAAVLGGGNTAIDAARSLRRLGLSDVLILYRRSRAEMPALSEEIHEAESEGVQIEFLSAPMRIVGDENRGVVGVECTRMRLETPDGSGRPRPVPVEGSGFLVKVDFVIPAIGQIPDTGFLNETPGIDTTTDRRIRLQPGGFMTGRPGVFAAGDAVSGAGMTVIEAIGMGKKAAAEVDSYLRGVKPEETGLPVASLPVFRRTLSEGERKPLPRVPVSTLAVSERVQGFEEVEQGYTEAEAISEAGRCLGCGPCGECLACVHACKVGAIDHMQRETLAEISVGRIIYADDPGRFPIGPFVGLSGVLRLPRDILPAGSSAASELLAELPISGPRSEARTSVHIGAAVRIGVFVCRCGDEISCVVDTSALADCAGRWPDVVHALELPFSCTADAAGKIHRDAEANRLDRVVIAGCTCCAVDQVCYGCTFQRIRCKQNLGVLEKGGGGPMFVETFSSLPAEAHRFVNIREHCAWPHSGDPAAATAKAAALLAGAVAEARAPVISPMVSAVVAADRCRACGTCVEICEAGAARISEFSPPAACIDPAICTGCGVCVAVCPSCAISAGDGGEDRLTALIEGVLS